MKSLKEDNPDLYAKQFSRFVRAGIEPSSVRRDSMNFSTLNRHLFFFVRCSSKLCTKLLMRRFVLIHRHRPRNRRKKVQRNRNGEKREKKQRIFSFHSFVFVSVGTKLNSLDHRVKIVFNNVKQLISNRYKVVMPNKFTMIQFVFYRSNHQTFVFVFILSISTY